MVTYFTGNAIPAPAYTKGSAISDEEILYSSNQNYVQKGVTLKPGQGVLPAGTLLKQDVTTKQYVKATDNTATGILRKTVDTGTDTAGQVWLANILYSGLLKYAAVSAANSTVNLASGILGGTVNAVAGFFKF